MEHRYRQPYEGEGWAGWWWFGGAFLMIIFLAVMILLPNFTRAKASGAYTQCQSHCRKIGEALEAFAKSNDGQYPRSLTMLTPDYLATIPTCEGYKAKIELIRRKRPSYCDTYTVSDDLRVFTLYCGSRDHDICGTPDNFPQYTSTDGLRPRQ